MRVRSEPMSVHPADSEIFGGAMGNSRDARALFRRDASPVHARRRGRAGAGRGEARHGPRQVAEGDYQGGAVENLRSSESPRRRETGVPVPALVREAWPRRGRRGRALHPSGSDHAGYPRHRAGPSNARRARAICGATSSRSRARSASVRASTATRRWPGGRISSRRSRHLRAQMRGVAGAARRPCRTAGSGGEPSAVAVEFGGAAGTLASLGAKGIAVTEGLAKELGLAAPDVPWHVERERVAEAAAFLGLSAAASPRSPPTSSC